MFLKGNLNGTARCLALAGALAFCAGAVPAATTQTASSPSDAATYFGINGVTFFHRPDKSADLARRWELMKELGVRWDRSDFWWHEVEPAPGQWKFDLPDTAVAAYLDHGVQMLAILNYGAAWTGGRGPVGASELDQWGNYVEKVVSRYADRLSWWEVWNEPNILPFWRPEPNPEHYAELLKTTAFRARKANPNARILAFAAAGLDLPFIERVLELTGPGAFDAVSYHYYRAHDPENLTVEEVDRLRLTLDHFGTTCPIWVTEMGVTSHFVEGVSEQLQAVNLVRQILLLIGAGVERVFPFTLRDNPSDPGGDWGTKLGIVTLTDDWRRKPAFFAYKTLIAELDAYRLVGPVHLGDSIHALLFEPRTGEGPMKLAAWSVSDSRDVRFPVDTMTTGGCGEYTTLLGERLPVECEGGIARVAVSPAPVYVPVWSARLLQDARTGFASERIMTSPGYREITTLTVAIDDARTTAIKFSAPKGWRVTGTTEVEILVPDDAVPGFHEIVATIPTGRGATSKTLRVWVRPPLRIDFRPYFTSATEMIETTVSIRSLNSKYAAAWNWEVRPSLPEFKLQPGRLEAGDNMGPWFAEAVFAVPRRAFKGLRRTTDIGLEVVADLDGGRRVERHETVFRIGVTPILRRSPVIDGNLRETGPLPRIEIDERRQLQLGSWDGPRDASAQVWSGWTDDGLYVAAEITDDVPMKNISGAGPDVYKGDGLELYVGPSGYYGQVFANPATGAWHFCISPGPDGSAPVVSDFFSAVSGSSAAARPSRNGYVLEAFIPKSAIGGYTASDGDLIAWDVQVNDLDAYSDAPDHAHLTWCGDSMNWLKAGRWGMAVVRR